MLVKHTFLGLKSSLKNLFSGRWNVYVLGESERSPVLESRIYAVVTIIIVALLFLTI